jgi:uncharacterized protein
MEPEMPVEYKIILILVLGGFTFSFAGFGFALVTLPLLSLLLPVKISVGFIFPYVLVLVLYHTGRFGKILDRRILLPLIVGACLAIPAGLWSLHLFPEVWLKRCLAVFIVLSIAASRFWSTTNLFSQDDRSRVWGLVCGLLGGWLQGAYAAGGPPAVIFVRSIEENPERAKGYLGAYFSVINLVTAVTFVVGDVFTAQWLWNSLLYSPAVLVGTVAGALFSNRINARVYRAAVDLLLLISSVMLWI